MNKKPYYQNFYKLQMAMIENDSNVVIFGPAASGKCDALERCIEEYGKENEVALLTRKTALLIEAYKHPDVTCINWDSSMERVEPGWFKHKYKYIIIDGYCKNWKEIIEQFPEARIIMAIRADANKDIPTEVKQSFRIVAKCGFIDNEHKVKGITSVRQYKG